MTTANDLIKAAFRKAGILSAAESPTSDMTNDALDTLNDLMETLANDGLMVYSRTTESFTLSGGTASYTIGSGGDFDTVRPVNIVSAYISNGETDTPVSVISDRQYAKIALKTTGGIPGYLNYSNAYPLATIRLYPAPSEAYTITLISEKPFTAFTLTGDVSLPPGWKGFLKNLLVVSLAPEYGQTAPQETLALVDEARKTLRKKTASMRNMDAFQPASGNDIDTGYMWL